MSGVGSYAVKPWCLALLGAGVLLGCGGEGSSRAPGALRTARAAEEVMAPDFGVSSVTAPASVIPGAPFNITVEVCNQGSDSGGTDVAFVVSSDEDLSAADTVIGNVFTPWLNPGQCFTQEVPVYGSAPEGSWYLGAIADPMNNQVEQDEQNNARAAGLFGVGFRPEFEVTQVSAPSSALPGASFNASATVCNTGTMGEGTSVVLSLSEDGSASPDDVDVAGQLTGFIPADSCVTLDLTGQLPPTEGTFHLLARVGPSQGGTEEFFPQNNVKDAGTLGVGFLPDFAVTSVTGPTSAQPSATFPVSVTVCNQGTAAGSTFFNVFLSPDAEISERDVPLAGDSTGFLAPGECVTREVTVGANGAGEGTYSLGAIADVGDAQAEFVESNNARASGAVTLSWF